MPVPDQGTEMLLDPARYGRGSDQEAQLHIPDLSRFREIGGGHERFATVRNHAFGVQHAGRLAGRSQRSRVVVSTGQAGPRPLTVDEVLGEAANYLAVERGIAALAANVDAEGDFERFVGVEAPRQGLEHGLPLVDRKTDGQHPRAPC